MTKIIKASKGSYSCRLPLSEEELAVLKMFRDKTEGSVALSITHVSVADDVIFVTRKDGMYEVLKDDLPVH